MARFIIVMLLVCLLLPGQSPVQVQASGGNRMLLAFYYAWFDENTWNSGITPHQPLQRYHSSERSAMERHVARAKAAGINGFVSSWIAPGNPTDERLAMLLDVAQQSGNFYATLDFEANRYNSIAELTEGLRYALNKYYSHPNVLRYGGKPVLFFWSLASIQGGNKVAAWNVVRQQVDPNRAWVWIAEGVTLDYQQVFDGHHLYSVAWNNGNDPGATLRTWGSRMASYNAQSGTQKLWVATVMPGYDDRRARGAAGFVRDRAGGQFYRTAWKGAIDSNPQMVIITSFNEWVEGSEIEPSVEYGDTYLKLTYELSAPLRQVTSNTDDYIIANGQFYTQANGEGATGRGYLISDEGVDERGQTIRFWSEYKRLGGPAALGYPASRRFVWNGFVCQATQKVILQWRPDQNRVNFVNVIDLLSAAGKDGWLQVERSTPASADWSGDNGLSWQSVVTRHLALLDKNAAIKRVYLSVPYAVELYGLPVAYADYADVSVLRAQRVIFQYWKRDFPWARAGTVTMANGGDLAKEAGLIAAIDGNAVVPQNAP